MAVLERGSSRLNPDKKDRSFLWNLGALGANYGNSMLQGMGLNLGVEMPELTDDWAKTINPLVTSYGNLNGSLGIKALTMGMGGNNTTTVSKYGGKLKYCKGGKMKYPDGGIVNPVPNKYIIIPKRVPKVLNGEQLATLTTVNDTLVGQDYGSWGEGLRGVNVPLPLPRDTKGKVLYGNKIDQNTMVEKKKYGGMLTRYSGNTHEFGGIPISQTDEVEDNETSFNMSDGNKYIFSHSIPFPDKKYSFADKSKRIEAKYKKRLKGDDKLATDALKIELEGLANLQESLKQEYNAKNYRYGGRIQHGEIYDPSTLTSDILPQAYYNNALRQPYNNSTPPLKIFTAAEAQALMNKSLSQPQKNTRLAELPDPHGTPVILGNSTPNYSTDLTKFNPKMSGVGNSFNPGYNQDFTIPALGYAAQALSNLPSLLTKEDKVRYDRITPDKIDLSQQRTEARRNRNLAYSTAQRNSGLMGNKAGNYVNAALSGLLTGYGDVFNQSILAEQLQNMESSSKTKFANADIAMKEAEAKQMEKDAVRSIKNEAYGNLGDIAATAGNDYQKMMSDADMMDWLRYANPDYSWKYDPMTGKKIPYRIKNKYGGKVRRVK